MPVTSEKRSPTTLEGTPNNSFKADSCGRYRDSHPRIFTPKGLATAITISPCSTDVTNLVISSSDMQTWWSELAVDRPANFRGCGVCHNP